MSPTFLPSAVVILAILALAGMDLSARLQKKSSHYAFGVLFGSIVGVGLIHGMYMLLGSTEWRSNGFVMAAGVAAAFFVWRLLFGKWDSATKATVLGTVMFWIAFAMLFSEPAEQRLPHLFAVAIATIPAVIWCLLFLPYHRERLSVVLTMFFAGMLSTVPILFYDALVRRGIELNFFFFRIVPESFNSNAQLFVSGHWPGIAPLQTSLLSMIVSYIFVGLIEEGSKFWMLLRVGQPIVRSIDDVMQLAILVAIGFAFAENITNTGYFLSFVRQYLSDPATRDWAGFFGNVAGRSILTSMVHIVSTGVFGYFLGKAIFAEPILREGTARGRSSIVIEFFHDILGAEKKDLYRREMLVIGAILASSLHALSNILVSLPDVLPSHPRTIGDLFGLAESSPLHYIALLVVPTLVYVGGGFLLLTWLFARKENLRERGQIVTTDTFVTRGEEE